MDFTFERHVYCHDLVNPPAQNHSCDVDLKLTNSSGLISIERVETDSAESAYLITVPSGNNLGFKRTEQADLEVDFANLVLGFNLTQERICMNFKRGHYPPFKVTPKVPASKTSVLKRDGGFHLHSEDTVVVRDEAYTISHIWGTFGEDKVADIFQKIQKLGRSEKKNVSQLETMNLNDALSKYESGIAEFERLVKFKHFFNSLELVTNMAGKQLYGDDLDNAVQSISSVSKTDVNEWRHFYNRTKHIQEGSDHIKTYYEGIDILHERLPAIRTCLNEILLSKL